MGDHDESAKPALSKDTPPAEEGQGKEGLGTESGASDEGSNVTKKMPDARGEVRYPDMEDPDELRSDAVPQEGKVEENPATEGEASRGAKGDA